MAYALQAELSVHLQTGPRTHRRLVHPHVQWAALRQPCGHQCPDHRRHTERCATRCSAAQLPGVPNLVGALDPSGVGSVQEAPVKRIRTAISHIPWAALGSCVAWSVCATVFAPAPAKAQVFLQSLLANHWWLLCTLYIKYFCSWLVDSKVPLLQRVGKITNSARKDIFAALQWAHFLCITSALVLVSPAVHNAINRLLPDAVWSVTAGIDSVAIEWLNRSVPFVLVTSICLQLLGSIEGRRLTSKARMLELDAQGPGHAHPVMTQGAQNAARWAVAGALVLGNAALVRLNYTPIHAAFVAVLLMLAMAMNLTIEERASYEFDTGKTDSGADGSTSGPVTVLG